MPENRVRKRALPGRWGSADPKAGHSLVPALGGL